MTTTAGSTEVVEPDYAGRGLASVLPNVASAVGLDGWPDHLGLPPAPHYVVVLVDGLGHRLLEQHADEAPYLAGLAEGTGGQRRQFAKPGPRPGLVPDPDLTQEVPIPVELEPADDGEAPDSRNARSRRTRTKPLQA